MPWTLLVPCLQRAVAPGPREDLVSHASFVTRWSSGFPSGGHKNPCCPSEALAPASAGKSPCELEKTVVPPSVQVRPCGKAGIN